MFVRFYGVNNLKNNTSDKSNCKICNNYSIISQNNVALCGNIYDEYFLKQYSDDLYLLAYENICECLGDICTCDGKVKVNTLIISLHGWGASSKVCESVSKVLSNFGFVVAPDFYGFGESGKLTKVFSVYDYLDTILKLINCFDFENVVIFVHSFGARVLFEMFERKMKGDTSFDNVLSKLKGVIITGGAGVKPRFNLIKYLKVKRYKYLKKKCKSNKKYVEKLSKYGSNDYKNTNDEYLRKTFVKVVNSYYSDCMKEIFCNTCIIHGKDDRETPLYMAKKMHSKIKNSELFIISGAGHFAFLDKPVIFENHLTDFLSRLIL